MQVYYKCCEASKWDSYMSLDRVLVALSIFLVRTQDLTVFCKLISVIFWSVSVTLRVLRLAFPLIFLILTSFSHNQPISLFNSFGSRCVLSVFNIGLWIGESTSLQVRTGLNLQIFEKFGLSLRRQRNWLPYGVNTANWAKGLVLVVGQVLQLLVVDLLISRTHYCWGRAQSLICVVLVFTNRKIAFCTYFYQVKLRS